jgi:hypothetical protein
VTGERRPEAHHPDDRGREQHEAIAIAVVAMVVAVVAAVALAIAIVVSVLRMIADKWALCSISALGRDGRLRPKGDARELRT